MIYDRFYYDYVCSLGLLPRKSINGSSLVPSPGFEGAFLHGLLDSDGSVCISHGSAEVIWYGSEAQMLWVLDHLEKQFLHPYFGKNPNNVFCVRLGNPASLVRLRKILNSRIRIPRKIDALQDFLVRRSLI